MKKLIILVLLVSSYSASQAQVLEVIDKIAGVLLPSITTSVKDVIDNTSMNRRNKKETKEEVEDAVKAAQRGLLNDIGREIENLTMIRRIFTISRQMTVSIGGLDMLTDKNFISHIMATDAVETKRVVAIQFSLFYSDIQDKKIKLEALDLNSLDPNLLTSLQRELESMQKAITKINSINGFTGGTISLEENISITQANNKVKAIDLSVEYIEDIKDSVEQISLLIDARIKSYELAFTQMKQQFQQ